MLELFRGEPLIIRDDEGYDATEPLLEVKSFVRDWPMMLGGWTVNHEVTVSSGETADLVRSWLDGLHELEAAHPSESLLA